MRILSIFVSFVLALCFPPSVATAQGEERPELAGYDVVLLGEAHDNPHHHAHQRAIVATLQPRAIVWEMLTVDQADLVTADMIGDLAALGRALKWAESSWPSFDMYGPIFQAAPAAVSYGGHVPRPAARAAFKTGVAAAFGDGAAQYGLLSALPDAEQAARDAGQMAAHCNALPEDLLPKMVAIQRLRDATLARAVVQAFTETGGPVVVITGSGHVRTDWGVPAYLARVAPELSVFALGQSEDGNLVGDYDAILDSPAVDRGDPCAAFKTKE